MASMLVAKEVDGIEMGVLADGTAFLTGAGLASACGVGKGVIYQQAINWKDGKRDGKLAKMIAAAGFDEDLLYTPLEGGRVHAYSDSICALVIAYYAFEAKNDIAQRTALVLVRQGLKDFIYRSVGFDPRTELPKGLRDFHDRLMLSTAPAGHYSVLREMAEFLLRVLHGGLPPSSATVPDISVGIVWAEHWAQQNLAARFGERVRHEHNYPDYYPQSASNPQEIWVYPIESLGEFRRWLDAVYIPNKFPEYLKGKVRKNVLQRADADRLLAVVVPAQLTGDAGE